MTTVPPTAHRPPPTELITRSERETEALGEQLAATLRPTDVVYLVGELGAGKTTFARGVARGLGASNREVASPTFALVNEYAGKDGRIVLRHLDLYRLADSEPEIEALGLPESVAGAPACVEWPRPALRRLLPPTVEVSLEVISDDARRVGSDDARRVGSDDARRVRIRTR